MNCDLLKKQKIVGRSIAVNRSKVSKRSKRFFNVNLQLRHFETEKLGNFSLRICVKAIRCIDKFGSLENMLLSINPSMLSENALNLKKRLQV